MDPPSSHPERKQTIQIIEKISWYDKTTEDSWTIIFFWLGNNFYKAKSDLEAEDIDETNVLHFDRVLIPTDRLFPSSVPGLTQGPLQSSPQVYVKDPSFTRYDPSQPYQVATTFLHEVQVLEELSKSPHPNTMIVKYLGCVIKNGRIHGICLEHCGDYLQLRVEFGIKFNKQEVMDGVRRGVKHLHDLGYCHNDISPYNIMFRKDESVVLIDFDACQRIGEKKNKLGTFGFCDRTCLISRPENDFYSISRLEEYLATGEFPEPK